MPSSSIIRIRLSGTLRQRLDTFVKKTQQDRDILIERAVDEYLKRTFRDSLTEEARRQSLLARSNDSENTIWEDNADTNGWRP